MLPRSAFSWPLLFRRKPNIPIEDAAATWLSRMLTQAAEERVSDIHLDPACGETEVKWRIDGILQPAAAVPAGLWLRVLGRLKVLGGLDLLDAIHPQDGVLEYDGVSWRVAMLPAVQGTRVVLRRLDDLHSGGLAAVGVDGDAITSLRAILSGTGLVVITGPANCGKTTTLYACLGDLARAGKVVVSVEDPVESIVAGVTQVPVRIRSGFGFAEAMRAALRHDPQVLAVGEVREEEGAQAAIRAALSGHLVLCTLHAGSVAAAVERWLELGVDRHQLAEALAGVVEQRLLRCFCPNCRGTAKSCLYCRGTGWRGRVAMVAVAAMSPAWRQALLGENRGAARSGYRRHHSLSWWRSAVQKVDAGITTWAEIHHAWGVGVSEEADGSRGQADAG